MIKRHWKKIDTYELFGDTRVRYQYTGTGHFPEILSRLEKKIGPVLYADCIHNIIHITLDQEAKL